MRLDIRSAEGAWEYEPRENSYAIRIFPSLTRIEPPRLTKNKNWVDIKSYYFDDAWPRDWKEYSWIDFEEPMFSDIFGKSWEEINAVWPKMTKKSFVGLLESRGWPDGRTHCFDGGIARKIMDDFEEVRDGVENIMIHCSRGENRSPAVGIAMNDIYGWGILGLKETFPNYRRFVYSRMIDVARGKLIK